MTWRVIESDALSALLGMYDESIHCCVTSPPYWALRDYDGVAASDWPAITYAPMPGVPEISIEPWSGQLGHEPTPAMYVAHIVTIMRELARVLRDDGTLWINLGDTYVSQRGKGRPGGRHFGRHNRIVDAGAMSIERPNRGAVAGYKSKDLAGIPWRVAQALQADGWYLRSDIVWAKPNCMPSSVRDRPTTAHEYLFLLSKGPRYYYDQLGSLEPFASKPKSPGRFHLQGQASLRPRGNLETDDRYYGRGGRNLRTVWRMATGHSRENHFASYPLELAARCINLATSKHGVCAACGSQWVREVSRTKVGEIPNSPRAGVDGDYRRDGNGCRFLTRYDVAARTIGWTNMSCGCGLEGVRPEPATVLDIFAGTGTTGRAALAGGRSYVGVEPSAAYVEMQRLALGDATPLFASEVAS